MLKLFLIFTLFSASFQETCTHNTLSPINIQPPIIEKGAQEMYFQLKQIPQIELIKQSEQIYVIQGVDSDYGTIIYDDVEYNLLKVYVKFPSDHQITGNTYTMELQVQAMNRLFDVITFACIFVAKESVGKHPFEDWGLGYYMKQMMDQGKAKIYGNKKYIKNGTFALNQIIEFNERFIEYDGETTFQPCRKSKWFIMNKPIYVDERIFSGFPTKKSIDRLEVVNNTQVKFYQIEIKDIGEALRVHQVENKDTQLQKKIEQIKNDSKDEQKQDEQQNNIQQNQDTNQQNSQLQQNDQKNQNNQQANQNNQNNQNNQQSNQNQNDLQQQTQGTQQNINNLQQNQQPQGQNNQNLQNQNQPPISNNQSQQQTSYQPPQSTQINNQNQNQDQINNQQGQQQQYQPTQENKDATESNQNNPQNQQDQTVQNILNQIKQKTQINQQQQTSNNQDLQVGVQQQQNIQSSQNKNQLQNKDNQIQQNQNQQQIQNQKINNINQQQTQNQQTLQQNQQNIQNTQITNQNLNNNNQPQPQQPLQTNQQQSTQQISQENLNQSNGNLNQKQNQDNQQQSQQQNKIQENQQKQQNSSNQPEDNQQQKLNQTKKNIEISEKQSPINRIQDDDQGQSSKDETQSDLQDEYYNIDQNDQEKSNETSCPKYMLLDEYKSKYKTQPKNCIFEFSEAETSFVKLILEELKQEIEDFIEEDVICYTKFEECQQNQYILPIVNPKIHQNQYDINRQFFPNKIISQFYIPQDCIGIKQAIKSQVQILDIIPEDFVNFQSQKYMLLCLAPLDVLNENDEQFYLPIVAKTNIKYQINLEDDYFFVQLQLDKNPLNNMETVEILFQQSKKTSDEIFDIQQVKDKIKNANLTTNMQQITINEFLKKTINKLKIKSQELYNELYEQYYKEYSNLVKEIIKRTPIQQQIDYQDFNSKYLWFEKQEKKQENTDLDKKQNEVPLKEQIMNDGTDHNIIINNSVNKEGQIEDQIVNNQQKIIQNIIKDLNYGQKQLAQTYQNSTNEQVIIDQIDKMNETIQKLQTKEEKASNFQQFLSNLKKINKNTKKEKQGFESKKQQKIFEVALQIQENNKNSLDIQFKLGINQFFNIYLETSIDLHIKEKLCEGCQSQSDREFCIQNFCSQKISNDDESCEPKQILTIQDLERQRLCRLKDKNLYNLMSEKVLNYGMNSIKKIFKINQIKKTQIQPKFQIEDLIITNVKKITSSFKSRQDKFFRKK